MVAREGTVSRPVAQVPLGARTFVVGKPVTFFPFAQSVASVTHASAPHVRCNWKSLVFVLSALGSSFAQSGEQQCAISLGTPLSPSASLLF